MRVHTLGGSKVNDVAIRLEHVDLLDSLDGLSAELLQGLLKLLVVGARAGGSTLDLSPGGALSTIKSLHVSRGLEEHIGGVSMVGHIP